MKPDVVLTADLMHGIAREMGPGWRAELPSEESGGRWGDLHGPDGAEVGLNATWNAGRIEIYGRWPRPRDGVNVSSPSHPHITVAGDAPPARIAREISRRFLPGYLDALASYKDRLREATEYHDAQARLRSEIVGLVAGGRHYREANQRGESIVYFDEGEARCYPDRVDLRIHVSPALALAILRGVVMTRPKLEAPAATEDESEAA